MVGGGAAKPVAGCRLFWRKQATPRRATAVWAGWRRTASASVAGQIGNLFLSRPAESLPSNAVVFYQREWSHTHPRQASICQWLIRAASPPLPRRLVAA